MNVYGVWCYIVRMQRKTSEVEDQVCTQPTGAQPISVSDAKSSAEFTIRNRFYFGEVE